MRERILDGAAEFARKTIRSGSALAGLPLRYGQDGLFTTHHADFLKDEKFVEAYRLGVAAGKHRHNTKLRIQWRVYTCCWAAIHAKTLGGDYVECGVYNGTTSRAVMHYVDFETMGDRTFYLLDTFDGPPKSQYTAEELELGVHDKYRDLIGDYESVLATFSRYPNARIVRGVIPDTLAKITSDRIGYVSIDMNAAAPEIEAMAFLWERMLPGAIAVLDDYNWSGHEIQRHAFDDFARSKGTIVMPLPTGQGLLVRS